MIKTLIKLCHFCTSSDCKSSRWNMDESQICPPPGSSVVISAIVLFVTTIADINFRAHGYPISYSHVMLQLDHLHSPQCLFIFGPYSSVQWLSTSADAVRSKLSKRSSEDRVGDVVELRVGHWSHWSHWSHLQLREMPHEATKNSCANLCYTTGQSWPIRSKESNIHVT